MALLRPHCPLVRRKQPTSSAAAGVRGAKCLHPREHSLLPATRGQKPASRGGGSRAAIGSGASASLGRGAPCAPKNPPAIATRDLSRSSEICSMRVCYRAAPGQFTSRSNSQSNKEPTGAEDTRIGDSVRPSSGSPQHSARLGLRKKDAAGRQLGLREGVPIDKCLAAPRLSRARSPCEGVAARGARSAG